MGPLASAGRSARARKSETAASPVARRAALDEPSPSPNAPANPYTPAPPSTRAGAPRCSALRGAAPNPPARPRPAPPAALRPAAAVPRPGLRLSVSGAGAARGRRALAARAGGRGADPAVPSSAGPAGPAFARGLVPRFAGSAFRGLHLWAIAHRAATLPDGPLAMPLFFFFARAPTARRLQAAPCSTGSEFIVKGWDRTDALCGSFAIYLNIHLLPFSYTFMIILKSVDMENSF